MSWCTAVNCTNSSKKGFRMFRYPRDPVRRKTWVQNSRRDRWTPTVHSVLCEIHFEPSQFENNRLDGWKKLKPNAIPTIFNVPNPPKLIDPSRRKSLYKVPKTGPTSAVDTSTSNFSQAESCCSNSIQETADVSSETQARPLPDEAECVCSCSCKTTKAYLAARNAHLEEQVHLLQNILKNATDELEASRKEHAEKVRSIQQYNKGMNDALETFLNQEQIASLTRTKVKEWSFDTVIKALKFRFSLGVHGYMYLHKSGYPMPSYSTLNRRLSSFAVSPGILKDLLEPLEHKVQCMEPEDRFCSISMDEMQIKSSEDFQVHEKTFAGYVSLGDMESEKKEIGTHLLLILVRGLRTNWKQVVACHITSSKTKKHHVTAFLKETIAYVEECGLRVLTLSSDMGHMNTGVWKELNVYSRKDGATRNSFYFNDHDIFVLPDVCHLVKNLKNAVLSQDIKLSPDLVDSEQLPTDVISGSYIKDFWELEVNSNRAIRLLHHLKREDLFPSNFEKMHVGSAVRFFSAKTAAALRLAIDLKLAPPDAITTAWFIDQVSLWFEMTSARQRKVTITRRNKSEKLLFLVRFVALFRGLAIGNSWKPLNSGVILATTSICDVSEILLGLHGFKFLLTHRFNQDALENCFSQIRRRAGATPTASQCFTAIKTLTISQFVTDVQKTNYSNDLDVFLLDYFTKKGNPIKNQLPIMSFSFQVPNFETPFKTTIVNFEAVNALQPFSDYDLNLLFYLSGCCLRALLKKKLCSQCISFFSSESLNNKYSAYVKKLNKGGLLMPRIEIFNLIVNCEIFYQKYLYYVLHNGYEMLLTKLDRDIDINFQNCSACVNSKFFIMNHFFKIRSFSTVSLRAAKRKTKKMYGTAHAKKQKV